MILVIALAEIPVFGRLLRTGILVQRGREYVTAARVGGTSGGRILTRHILPNAADPLVVQIAVSLTVAVFIEGAMSFLGVGVRPPSPPSEPSSVSRCPISPRPRTSPPDRS